MQSVVESLPDLAREQGAVTAVRDRSGATWRFLSWSELMGEVNRVVGAFSDRSDATDRFDAAPRVERGRRLMWSAPPGTRRLVVDLALLHLGAIGVQSPTGASDAVSIDVAAYEGLIQTREQAGRLVRLVTELRARDPAAVYRGSALTQQGVVDVARRVAAAVDLAAPNALLVSAPGPAEQSCAWGAVVGGYGIVVGGADLLPTLSPKVWLCTADQLRSLAGGPGALGAGRLRSGLRRALGGSDPVLGGHLSRVFVDGAVPAEAQALRDRGVEVFPWPA